MKYKVFLDTSTLVASSVLLTTKTIGLDIKDVFYDEAIQLISIIRKHVNKRIGITTSMVEEEAYHVLSSSIERKLSQKISDRVKVFEILSIAVNACESRLRDVLSFVTREPVNPKDSAKLYTQVVIAYEELLKHALNLPKPAYMQAKTVPKFLNKAEMFEMYQTQDECLNAQLTNLIYNPIEDTDKMILAQATYLCKLFKETETKITMFLSSTDHHFVPVRRYGYTSRQVTDKIEEKFDILADKPQKIFLALKQEYGE